jgi:hypothetical protein
MTRTLLTAIFLTLFSQTAWASDVYLCKKSGFNYTDLETMEVGQGIQFGVATEDQGIQEKPFIPTIAEYDFKLIEVRINKRQTIFWGTANFLKTKAHMVPGTLKLVEMKKFTQINVLDLITQKSQKIKSI